MKKLNTHVLVVACGCLLFMIPKNLEAKHIARQDTCNTNDICATATLIPNVISDNAFVCITSCNTGASPEAFNNSCNIGDFPTTWFMIQTDGAATLINIHIGSDDIDAPVISLFLANPDCSDLIPVPLTASNLPCVVGSNGEAEAVSTDVGAHELYFLAVSALHHQTGEFEVCVNTVSGTSNCVTSRDIEIEARSGPGPLTGPFYPAETVSVCLNINSYSAANNGCQWFQGVIPVFGNGWDPSSFSVWGEPLNATINGNLIGVAGNGLYGTATWDWFADVDYHYDHPFLQGGDFDGNGTYELCNLLYEVNCPNTGGLTGGCCNPCWGTPFGTILPSGWFAYGINGSCPSPGPPVRVDWGDGNTCGGGMGPWRFCFDLVVRNYPGCLEDETTSNLTIGFITTTDGETGAWTGNPSICALDQPAKITFPMKCGQLIELDTEVLPSLCSGDSLIYIIEHPEVQHWEWSIFPPGHIQPPVFEGENGYEINQLVINTTNAPKTITYRFIGDIPNSDDEIIKEMVFTIFPQIQFNLTDLLVCERDSVITLNPAITGGTGSYVYQWSPTGATTPAITLFRPFPPQVSLQVGDEAGCTRNDAMQIKTRPCHLIGTEPPVDDDNEPDGPKDAPPPVLPFTDPGNITSRSVSMNNKTMEVTPVPSHNEVLISLQHDPLQSGAIYIIDVNGHVVRSLHEEQPLHTRMRVNISDLVPGVYFIHYHSGASINTARLVKL